MGWSDCGNDDLGRPVGYGFGAICDEDDCDASINRGLSYVCGSMHGGGEDGCGRYHCPEHQRTHHCPHDEAERSRAEADGGP